MWAAQQVNWDPNKLVFLDESGAKTNMTRMYGRCPRDQRLNAHAPNCRWQSTTMIGSIRFDGSTECLAIEGATNAEVFQAYIKEVLLPTLNPGDIVVMDNLSAHKNKDTLALLEQAEVTPLFLPPYSPDFNPIEMMWSKVKAILRRIEARDPDSLIDAIAEALGEITPQDAFGWFTHCGYNFA